MRAKSGDLTRLFVVLALMGGAAIASVGVSAARADDPVKPGQPIQLPAKPGDPIQAPAPSAAPVKKAESESADKAGPKTIEFEIRDKPWKSVLEWVSEKSGMGIIAKTTPKGSFTYYSPGKKAYTIPEVIDILNGSLLSGPEKHILVRHDQNLILVAADEPIDPAILPRIQVKDLKDHGNTEMVQVVMQLKSLLADEVAKEMKDLMGPFGKVVPLSAPNQLVLTDTVGNINRIVQTLEANEGGDKGQSTYSHKCVYIKARDAEQIVKDLLGTSDQMKLNQPQQPNPYDRFSTRIDMGGGTFQQRTFPPQQPAVPAPKVRMHYVRADDRSNTIYVAGPADKIAQAREIIERLDVGQDGQKAIDIGDMQLKMYSIASGNADALAKTLQERYKPPIKIYSAGTSSIVALAYPEDQKEIDALIKGSKNVKTVSVELAILDAATTATKLQGYFGDIKSGGPIIDSEQNKNAIIIRGTEDQVAEVQAVLDAMGESREQSKNLRVITIEKGSAAGFAEALQQLLPKGQVKIIMPGKAPDKNGTDKSKPKGSGEEEQEPQDNKKNDKPFFDPQEKKDDKKTEGQGAPITITVVGNKIFITSDDPKALAKAQELARLMAKELASGTQEFEVIHLNNASAVEAAKVLDEVFNGPRQGNQANQAMAFMTPFMRPGTPLPTPGENKIRIVADPGSNSLIIKASRVELAQIKALLEGAIDAEEKESKGTIKSWIVGPLKHASATEVAAVVKDVYRENMNQNPNVANSASSFGGPFPSPFGRRRGGTQNLNIDANGNPRSVSLSVGVDDRSNSLVLACSDALHKDVAALVEKLDEAAGSSTKTITTVPVRGVDPVLVQQAIDAIQGRRSGGAPGSGGPGFVPFGTGGFVPGMSPRSSRGGFYPGGGGYTPGGGYSPSGGNFSPPGGGSRGPGPQSRGPDFFAERVTDDPEPTFFYDPHQDGAAQHHAPTSHASLAISRDPSGSIQLTRFEAQQPTQPPTGVPPTGENIRGPRSQVSAEALQELGIIVVSGNNQADVEATVKIIEMIIKLGAGSEFKFELVPLQVADATSVANTLSQLYQRVLILPTANVQARQAGTGAQPSPFGQPTPAPTTAQGQTSIVLLPVPRLNALLVAAPGARMQDVKNSIKQLDVGTSRLGQGVPFFLHKASAVRVATLLTTFYNGRYSTESQAQNQIRITHDDSTNMIWVQAAPGDLKEIRDLIQILDTAETSAINEIRIVHLRNVLSDELASILQQTINQAVVAPTTSTTITPTTPTFPGRTTGPTGTPTPTPAPTPAAPTPSAGAGAATKTTGLRFFSRDGVVESGLLEDIHILSSPRINSLIILAPEKSMKLLWNLIQDLDTPPSLRAELKIFTLKKADANAMGTLLQQLFLGGGATTPGPTTPRPTGPTGGPTPTTPTGTGAPTATTPTLSGLGTEGTPLIALSITVDTRTNSIIVAGSRFDLDVVQALIYRLEDADVEPRRNMVYHLRNSSAADVATAVNNFLASSLQVLKNANQFSAFQEIERDVVVVPEPITNKLIISATPRYFDEIMKIIEEIDMEPPQVVIQALMAEVDLSGNEEFGVEIGLQSPILFQRGIIPGVTVSSTQPFADPGFNFNTTNPLGNTNNANPGTVGFQGLGNLGVGRSSTTSGVGGFVFSASSQDFNLLVRALKTQGRIDILTRPQVTATDNQQAQVVVGQSVPFVDGATSNSIGNITPLITYKSIGIILQVTPRITPDGRVIMRVHPEISSLSNSQINLGNGILANSINDQFVDTTVVVQDGETVALGGLIAKKDTKNENKVPWLGDLPCVGALFRYRTQVKSKTELLIILTPHIVRNQYEREVIKLEEAKRMDWILGDVMKFHGTGGLESLLPPSKGGGRGPVLPPPGDLSVPVQPGPAQPGPAPVVPDQKPGELLPPARPLPTPPRPMPGGTAPPSTTSGGEEAPDNRPAAFGINR
jgi:type II secretion system protein D